MKLYIRILAAAMAAAVMGGMVLSVSAILPGFSPNVDPSLVKTDTLPEPYNQGFRDGMPYGWFAVSDAANYSFGIAKDRAGNIYTASFADSTVTKIMPDKWGRISLFSPEKSYKMPSGGLYAVAVDNDGNIVFATQLGFAGIYDINTGNFKKIMTDLTRPNQLVVDSENNVYCATETGQIYKWVRKTGNVETVVSEVDGALQSVLVAPDGTLYYLTFGKGSDFPLPGSSVTTGELWQVNRDGSSEALISGNDECIYRGRGLAMDAQGYIYLTGEGNVWDNGNSAVTYRFDPGTRRFEKLTSGTDYTTYIVCGSDGRLYQNAARDDYVLAYSEKADSLFTEQGWKNDGIRVITYGGSFVPSDDGNLTIKANGLNIKGTVSSDVGRVSGWIKIPTELLPELDTEWRVSNDWKYELPKVSASGEGQIKTAAMVCRVHMRARSPMIDVYTPAADFRENPEAYLIYFEWVSDDASTVNTDEFLIAREDAGSAYSSSSLDALDFTGCSAYDGKDGTDVDVLDLSKGSAEVITGSDKITFQFRTEKASEKLLFRMSEKKSGGSTVGGGFAVECRKDGRIIVSVRGKKSETVIPFNACDADWHSFLFTNSFGVIKVVIDGVALKLDGISDGEIQSAVGLPATYFSIEEYDGKFCLRDEGEINPHRIEASKTEKKADPLPYVILGTSVLVLAAAVTALATSKKTQKS